MDCAKAYVAEGAKVVLVARGKDAVEKAAAELGPEHLGMTCDLSRGDEGKAAIEKTLSNYGRLDAVHNNPGIGSPSKPQIPLEKHGERPKICVAPFIGFAI